MKNRPNPPPLAEDTREAMPTTDAARHLGRTQQTMRRWACNQNGPIQPVRMGRRTHLLWRTEDIRKLLRVEQAKPTPDPADVLKDAARYRWLRETQNSDHPMRVDCLDHSVVGAIDAIFVVVGENHATALEGAELDAAIDAAMRASV